MEDVLLWAKKLMKLGITMLSMAMPVVPAYGVSAAANTEGVALKGKYEEKYLEIIQKLEEFNSAIINDAL